MKPEQVTFLVRPVRQFLDGEAKALAGALDDVEVSEYESSEDEWQAFIAHLCRHEDWVGWPPERTADPSPAGQPRGAARGWHPILTVAGPRLCASLRVGLVRLTAVLEHAERESPGRSLLCFARFPESIDFLLGRGEVVLARPEPLRVRTYFPRPA